MKYEYRWVLFFSIWILMVALIWAQDINPFMHEIATMAKEEALLKGDVMLQRMYLMQQEKRMNVTPALPRPFFSDWLALIHLSGLSIRSMNVVAIGKLHLEASGDFSQLYSFATLLTSQRGLLSIVNFNFQATNERQLNISMDIENINQALRWSELEQPGRSLTINEGSFCTQASVANELEQSALKALQSVLINEIKMVGYMQEGGRRQAWLLLPNRSLIDISPGWLLGKERGLVSAINPDSVVVMLANHQRYTLKM